MATTGSRQACDCNMSPQMARVQISLCRPMSLSSRLLGQKMSCKPTQVRLCYETLAGHNSKLLQIPLDGEVLFREFAYTGADQRVAAVYPLVLLQSSQLSSRRLWTCSTWCAPVDSMLLMLCISSLDQQMW